MNPNDPRQRLQRAPLTIRAGGDGVRTASSFVPSLVRSLHSPDISASPKSVVSYAYVIRKPSRFTALKSSFATNINSNKIHELSRNLFVGQVCKGADTVYLLSALELPSFPSKSRLRDFRAGVSAVRV